MKIVLLAGLVVLFSSCVVPAKPAPRAPTPSGSGPSCPDWGCGANGTQMTGLAHGARAGTIETIMLLSGEVITLR